MPDSNKIQEFLDKLKPCIDKGELDACVDEATRLAEEMRIDPRVLLELSVDIGATGLHAFTYVMALSAAQGLEGNDKATAHYNAGSAAYSLGEVELSEEQYKFAIETNPNDASARINYGSLLKELNRIGEAEEEYKKAIETGQELTVVHYNYGILLNELNRVEEAEKQYELAIDSDPKYAGAYYNYANLLKKLNRAEEAEEQYKLAIQRDSKYASAHLNYGVLLKHLNRVEEAEEQYKLAIQTNPKLAEAHYSYANLLSELEMEEEKAEEEYKKAIEIDPEYVEAYSNYANLLYELEKEDEAEENYIKAIEINPNYENAYLNYAILLSSQERGEEAEENYIKAIEINPNYEDIHLNYALLLSNQGRSQEAEDNYIKAIEINPDYAEAHIHYAILLFGLKKYKHAEKYIEKAIDIDPNFPEAHGVQGFFLIETNKRKYAWNKIEIASRLLKEEGDITKSHLAKAWFYERYSEKNFKKRKFFESGEDAKKAADEYLKAANTVDGTLKDNFSQQGNILKAKSFIRKVPKKSRYKKILYRLGGKTDISMLINNLKEAASYYEKAAQCPIEEKQDACNACHISITVFSETLAVMEAFINNRSAEIDKKEWVKKLDSARLIYEEKEMKNGVALVDTLKQLIKCVDEMAVHRENGLEIQKDKCGKCFGKLADVSENLDGALNVLAEHSIEAIRDYAKQQGMGGFVSDEVKKSIWNNWFVRGGIFIVATIFLNLLSSKLYDLNILATIWNTINSLIP